MSTVTTNYLGDFLSEIRTREGWSREDVCVRARRRGRTISGSYIRKIEAGLDPDSISLDKYEALAAALGLEAADVIRIARGEDMAAVLDGRIPGSSLVKFPKKITSSAEVGAIVAKLPNKGSPLVQHEPSGHKVTLPVFDVACGEPLVIPEFPELEEEWDAALIRGANAIMRVRGTSMLGCGYRPGDHLFVQYINGVQPKSGDKVIAVIDGGVTCKIYRNDDLGEYIESAPGEGAPWRKPIKAGVRLVAIVRRRLTDE